MMLLDMDEVKILTEFFRNHVAKDMKSANVLINRIDDFNAMEDSDEDKNQNKSVNASAVDEALDEPST